MKLKLKNSDLIQLFNNLSALNHKGVKFSYAVARNISLIKPLTNALSESLVPSKGFMDYDKARVELAKTHSKKDEAGKPVVEGNNFVIEDMEKFESELKALQEKHKEDIDVRQKQLNDYASLQDEVVEFEAYPIKHEWLPEEIKTQELNGIFDLIEHEEAIPSPLSDELTGKKKGK